MTCRKPCPRGGITLLVLACAAASAQAAEPAPPRQRPPARLYTNADLERVHPFAAETGVRSTPAVPFDAPRVAEREPRPRGRGEAAWRREAAAVRERLRALEERAAALRARIAERARESPVFGRRSNPGTGAAALESLRGQLAALERRIKATQDDFEERARRDGALPGWLR